MSRAARWSRLGGGARAGLPPACCTPASARRWWCWRSAAVFGVTALRDVLRASDRRSRRPRTGRRCCSGSTAPQGVEPRLHRPPRCARSRTAPHPCATSGEVIGLFSIAGANGQRQQRLHDLHPRAAGASGPADSRRSSPTSSSAAAAVIGVRAFAGTAELARHPRRGAGAAVRDRRQRLRGRSARRAEALVAGWRRTRPSGRCGSPTRRPSRSSSSRSTASGPRTSASTSTGSARRCRRCSTAASVGSVFVDDRSYDIKLTSSTDPVRDPTDLESLFLQTRSGRDGADVDRW